MVNLLVIQGLLESEGHGASLWRLAMHMKNGPVEPDINLVTEHVAAPKEDLVTDQVVRTLTNRQHELLKACEVPRSLLDLMQRAGVTHRSFCRRKHLKPRLDAGTVRMTMPDHRNASNQRYVLTEPGVALKALWMAKE